MSRQASDLISSFISCAVHEMTNVHSLSAPPHPSHASVPFRPCSGVSPSRPDRSPPSLFSLLCQSTHHGHSPCLNCLLLWRFSARRSCSRRHVWGSMSSTAMLQCSLGGHWRVWYALGWPPWRLQTEERAKSALLFAFQPRYLWDGWRDAFSVIRPQERAPRVMPSVMVWLAGAAD